MMFKLFKLNDNKYLILKNDGKEFEGTKVQIIRELIFMMVKNDDIFVGLEALERHDVAYYGLRNTYIYSEILVKKSA